MLNFNQSNSENLLKPDHRGFDPTNRMLQGPRDYAVPRGFDIKNQPSNLFSFTNGIHLSAIFYFGYLTWRYLPNFTEKNTREFRIRNIFSLAVTAFTALVAFKDLFITPNPSVIKSLFLYLGALVVLKWMNAEKAYKGYNDGVVKNDTKNKSDSKHRGGGYGSHESLHRDRHSAGGSRSSSNNGQLIITLQADGTRIDQYGNNYDEDGNIIPQVGPQIQQNSISGDYRQPANGYSGPIHGHSSDEEGEDDQPWYGNVNGSPGDNYQPSNVYQQQQPSHGGIPGYSRDPSVTQSSLQVGRQVEENIISQQQLLQQQQPQYPNNPNYPYSPTYGGAYEVGTQVNYTNAYNPNHPQQTGFGPGTGGCNRGGGDWNRGS